MLCFRKCSDSVLCFVFRKCTNSVLCFVFPIISAITESTSSNLYVGVIGGLVGVILTVIVTVGILLCKRKKGNNYMLSSVALIFIKLVIIFFLPAQLVHWYCVFCMYPNWNGIAWHVYDSMFVFVKQGKLSDTNYYVVNLGSAREIKLKRVGERIDIVEREQRSKCTKAKLIKTSLCMLSYIGVPVTRSLVLYVCFVDRCLSFCTFSFGLCIACSSSICEFWLSLCYLQTLIDQCAELNIFVCHSTVQ